MNYREAIQHARSGVTVYCGGRVVRFLTFAEAEPILLEQTPSRRVVRDENGQVVERNGKIIVETFADPSTDLKRFGLYDVSSGEPVQFRPTDEDFAAAWNTEPPAVEPEVVAPEAVDEVLAETADE